MFFWDIWVTCIFGIACHFNLDIYFAFVFFGTSWEQVEFLIDGLEHIFDTENAQALPVERSINILKKIHFD